MKLASLALSQFKQRMATQGVRVRTGPFAVSLKSSIDVVAEAFHLMYGEYPLLDEGEFVDFYLGLNRPKGIRRWYRPQVRFSLDGRYPFKPLPFSQAFPMFEWTYNWCIANHMHRYLIIHGAVVERNGYAAIMPAPPGSGKSTLCAALVNRGWRLLSDELTLISLEDGSAVPIPRPVSLKNESIAIIRDYAPQAVMGRSFTDTKKGTVGHMKAPTTSIAKSTERARVGWVILPRYVLNAEPNLVAKSKARTCLLLAENAFNYSVLGETAFNVLTKVISNSDCYEFSYSRLDDGVAVFNELASKFA